MNVRRSFFFNLFVIFSTIFALTISYYAEAKKALVIVPVADLVGSPIANSDILVNYENIPLAAAKSKKEIICPRLHQSIFNEIVDITNEQFNEVNINISNVYYYAPAHEIPQTSYWTQKKNIIPLETLKEKGLDLHKIPQPIEFSNNGLALTHDNIITLIFPWMEPISRRVFSAGTRFVLCENQPTNEFYSIYLFDPLIVDFRQVELSKKVALKNSNLATHSERIVQFCKLLRKWAHIKDGFIPYVWGGSSFISISKNPFEKKEYGKFGTEIFYYSRHDIPRNPHTGFDCSGIIARAAQVCGIPYFFKNTTTLSNSLTSLRTGEALTEGDLIWIPGHVMVIASLANNTLIEARGYGSGYGKIHEIEIANMFKDIKDYGDLLKVYFAKKPLILLNDRKAIFSTIPDYKILKFASIWNKQ